MSNYIGVRCPVCNKKFNEADDIVVCPVCGAPHHRDCYMSANQCAFAKDHLSGKEWSDPAGQVPPDSDQTPRTCGRCGTANPPDNIFCQSCGSPLTLTPPDESQKQEQRWDFPGFQMHVDTISMAYGGLPPDEKIEGETVRDLANYVGNGSAYYLPRFRLISDRQQTISFNISAFLFNFLYYFYRKMYAVGVFLLLLYIISSVPTYLYTWEMLPHMLYTYGLGPAVELNYAVLDHLYSLSRLTRTINFFIGLVASLFANRYYLSRTLADVGFIRKASGEAGDSPEEYAHKLTINGGCNRKAVIALVATVMVIMLAISISMVYMRMIPIPIG